MTRPLAGSERRPMPGSKPVGRADPDERLEVTLLLRRRSATSLAVAAGKLHRHNFPRADLSRADFAAAYGSQDADAEAVAAFAERGGFAVVQYAPGRRTLVLSGTIEKAENAFGVVLQNYECAGGTFRGRVGAVHLPRELHGIVTAVLGLDNRPQAQPHVRLWEPPAHGFEASSHTPVEIAALYGFPPAVADGQTIGIVELGGGFRPADLRAYFAGLGLATPRVTVVSVDHGKNHPAGKRGGIDGGVVLDIEVIGAVAPGARIVVYFAPNTAAGFVDAVTTAVHDEINAPSVVSIGWGAPESAWTRQAKIALDEALQAAAMMGVTVCVASGDRGSTEAVGDGHEHVDFPASSPYALACGGTAIESAGGRLSGEVAWGDGPPGGASGGGESAFFELPHWQSGLQLTLASGVARLLERRGVPDVSAGAAPESGYLLRAGGTDTVAGGTGGVAPLWAALIARANAAGGRQLGFVNPLLYSKRAAFRDIVSGDNGGFRATRGWDACTGLGSPAPEVFETGDGAEPAQLIVEGRTQLART